MINERATAVRSLILVPAKHYPEVKRRIDAIREKDEPSHLEYDCQKLNEELIGDLGEEIDRDELVEGKQYGQIGYSMAANAVRKGRVIGNHGEIYLCVWVYQGNGVFYQQDAWGGIHEKGIPGRPLIEMN